MRASPTETATLLTGNTPIRRKVTVVWPVSSPVRLTEVTSSSVSLRPESTVCAGSIEAVMGQFRLKRAVAPCESVSFSGSAHSCATGSEESRSAVKAASSQPSAFFRDGEMSI